MAKQLNGENLKAIKKCSGTYILAVNDAKNVISGKWKLPIIGSLLFGKKRFKELEREIPKITPRMLSKELRELEINGIIIRTVYDSTPVTVEYELTKSGMALRNVLDVMIAWGLQHRKINIGKSQPVKEARKVDRLKS
jgi:DNA-binding HxlR family transcriptional regulator